MSLLPKFVTATEQQALLYWIQTTDIPILQPPNLPPAAHFPRRKKIFSDDGPQVFYDIQDRIKERFNLFGREPVDWNGQVFVHQPDMFTREHTDGGRSSNGSLRMTLMIQRAEEGGDFIHDQTTINIPERGLATYDGRIPHSVSKVITGERVVVVFFWSDS